MAENVTVWFLPGFMGSALYTPLRDAQGRDTGRQLKLWLDVRGILTGRTYLLLKYPDYDTVPVVVGEVLTEGYGNFQVTMLERTALPQGWRWQMYPYDWRRSIRDLGNALATHIEARAAGPGSHILVGHSMGGSVAVATWAALKARGKETLIRRILTLAGILYGSYSTARTWAEYENTLNLFALAPQAARLAVSPIVNLRVPDAGQIYLQLLQTFVTWPSGYDLLPDPAKGDDLGDHGRALCYDPAAWVSCLVQPRWDLWDTSKKTYHEWIHLPENIPPKNVLMHVCGIGQRTPARMHATVMPGVNFRMGNRRMTWEQRKAVRQADLPQWEHSDLGDNRATISQQELAGYYTVHIQGEHAELQNSPAFLNNLLGWLTDPIPIAMDPPPGIAHPPAFPERWVRARNIPPATAIADDYEANETSTGEPAEGHG